MFKNFTKILATLLLLLIANISQAQDYMKISINSPSTISADWDNAAEFGTSNRFSGLSMNDWGRTLIPGERVTGNIAIFRDSLAKDSLAANGCSTCFNAAEMKGKIALIGRGTCTFATKAYYAWKAGAIGVIILNDSRGPDAFVYPGATKPLSDSVSTAATGIPIVGTTQNNGLRIRNAILNGQTVNASFYLSNVYGSTTAYAFNTPQKEAIPLRNLSMRLINTVNTDSVARKNITVTATIKNPLGAIQTLTVKLDSLAGRKDTSVNFPTYALNKTSPKGNYTILFKNSLTPDSLKSDFNLTDNLFSLDKVYKYQYQPVSLNPVFYDAPANGKIFDYGSIFLTGGDTTRATHMSFAINNVVDYPVGDEFAIQVYSMTNANYAKMAGGTLSYTDVETDLRSEVIYKWKKTEKADSAILIELPKPVDLADSSFCMVSIRHDGSVLNTNCPAITTTYGNSFPQVSYYIYFFNQGFKMDREGYGNRYNPSVGLYTRRVTTDTKDLPALAENQVKVFPNPISDSKLNIEFDLKNVADVVNLQITDLQGNIVRTDKLYNVQKGVHQTDISNLANGTYFITSVTKEGWRTKSFQVIK